MSTVDLFHQINGYKCANCGKDIGNGDWNPAWHTSHLGRPSNDTVTGALVVYHCGDCDPLQARIVFMHTELERLQTGYYPHANSEEWDEFKGIQ